MEASILLVIVISFAGWCAWRCFKPQEKSEPEKRMDNDAWREDVHHRFKDVELPLPTGWSKSIKPGVSPTVQSQGSQQRSGTPPADRIRGHR
jgi:hypothetical protein